MIERRDVFQAIADPTRRVIISKLADGPLTISQIGEGLQISKQATAKHISILKDCGMLEMTKQGRNQICVAKLEKLDDVSDWIMQSKKLWNQRFEKLNKFLAKQQLSDEKERK